MADTPHTEVPKEPNLYLEARLGLMEELISQMMGGIPEEIADQLASHYNARRFEIIQTMLKGTLYAETLEKAMTNSKKKPPGPSLILVPHSHL